MSFSPGQWGKLRPLRDRAWESHCRSRGIDPKDQSKFRPWYESALQSATGKSSSKDCNKTTDFDHAWAHFEALCGDSIEANLNLFHAITRRIRYNVRKVNPDYLDQFATDTDFHTYLRGIARQIAQTAEPPELHELSADQVKAVNRAVLIDANRKLTKTATP